MAAVFIQHDDEGEAAHDVANKPEVKRLPQGPDFSASIMTSHLFKVQSEAAVVIRVKLLNTL